MSSPDEEAIKRRYREFIDLMPLTLNLAGLPPSEPHKSFTPEQMEIRVDIMLRAFKMARKAVRDVIRSD